MKLLYCGEEYCDQPVLKRMLVIAEEIHFMDRPSVTFGNWGTIGHASLKRGDKSKHLKLLKVTGDGLDTA